MGDPGEKGETGEPGDDIASIVGERGDPGEPGEDGSRGDQGPPGTADECPVVEDIGIAQNLAGKLPVLRGKPIEVGLTFNCKPLYGSLF